MNRIDAVFKRLKQEQKTAFIGFLTAGDPDIPTCMECVKQLEQNGCDIIEIGIPLFRSDCGRTRHSGGKSSRLTE